MKWAFIDYENVGCLDSIDLSVYGKIVVFLGAKQPKIDFGEKKYDSPVNLVLVQVKATQPNNLDFHLSYYLGKYDNEAETSIAFDIVSNDNGFSPLIAHIKSNGRTCKQVKLGVASGAKTKLPQSSKPMPKEKLIQSLKSKPKEKRPQKVTSLRNHIAAHLLLQGNEVAIQNYLNQLVNDQILTISGEGVEYKS